MLSNGFYVSLRKTSIVDVNEDTHALPPDKGPFQEFRVTDYPGCPKEWSKDGVFVEVKEGEPLWFDFRGNHECAVVCAVQRLNPVTGDPANLESGLLKDPKQNYLYLPDQMWLDGYAKDGKVYQFIVTKAGIGLAVNEYVLPKHMQDSHALGFAFYPAKIERKPKVSPPLMPNWFSPTHTPQSWNLVSPDSKGMSWNLVSPASKGMSPLRGIGGSSLNSAGQAPVGGAAYAEGDDEVVSTYCFASLDDVCLESDSIEVNNIIEKPDVQFDKASMGMGGRIVQRIVPDRNTPEYYHEKPAGVLTVYLALPEQFKSIMNQGRNQDASKKDKYIASGEVGGIQVPLITQ